MDKVTLESFLEDINRHKMTIIKDNGIYRHLRFKRPNTGNMYFDLITWPGHVCFTGDMGTYTFSRINDMAYFFSDPDETDEVKPNMGYWGEKLTSESMFGNGKEKYCEDTFIDRVQEWFDNWKYDYLRDNLPDIYELDDNNNIVINSLYEEDSPDELDINEKERLEDLIESEEHELMYYHLGGVDTEFESSAYQSIMNYKSDELGENGPCFQDFWEVDCRPYTYHYQWCCYALNWGFNQYFKYLNQKRFNLKYC